MTTRLFTLVIASLLAVETMHFAQAPAQALEMDASLTQISDRDAQAFPDYTLFKRIPGRRQGAGSL